MDISNRIAKNATPLNYLLSNLYEQDENGIPISLSLRKKPEERTHYLSLMYQLETGIADNIISEAREWLISIPTSNIHLQESNLHLTFASFGEISHNFFTSKLLISSSINLLKDKIKKSLEAWTPFKVIIINPTLGKSGVNFEIKAPNTENDDYDERIQNIEKEITTIKGSLFHRLSISIIRYLNPICNSKEWINYLTSLSNIKIKDFNIDLNISELKLVLLDKTAQSFTVLEKFIL